VSMTNWKEVAVSNAIWNNGAVVFMSWESILLGSIYHAWMGIQRNYGLLRALLAPLSAFPLEDKNMSKAQQSCNKVVLMLSPSSIFIKSALRPWAMAATTESHKLSFVHCLGPLTYHLDATYPQNQSCALELESLMSIELSFDNY
jgi:hypothetical protein